MTVTELPHPDRRPYPDRRPHPDRRPRSDAERVPEQIPLGSVDVHPVLLRAGTPPAARDLLAQAGRTLLAADAAEDPLERYATAHLAALRATAAVLAVRGRPEKSPRRRRAIRSAWEVLPEVAPELAEWALYFAAGAAKRAAAEAGMRGAASARDADDLIRNAAIFLRLVQRVLEPAGNRVRGKGPSAS